MVYFAMAMALFADDDEEAARLAGTLGSWNCWHESWMVPTSGGITRARKPDPGHADCGRVRPASALPRPPLHVPNRPGTSAQIADLTDTGVAMPGHLRRCRQGDDDPVLTGRWISACGRYRQQETALPEPDYLDDNLTVGPAQRNDIARIHITCRDCPCHRPRGYPMARPV
jgi:hypothetical protein